MKIKVDNEIREFKPTTLEEIAKSYQKEDEPMIMAALINNHFKELTEYIAEDVEIKWVDLTESDGVRIYQRTLSFVFIRAAMEIFRNIKVNIRHSLSKGLYCDFNFTRELSEDDVCKIKDRMKEIINAKEKIKKEVMLRTDAIQMFRDLDFNSKAELLEHLNNEYVSVYSCGWMKNYFYGYMLPNVSYLKYFDVIKAGKGVILRHPTNFSPMGLPPYEKHIKLGKVFREAEEWGDIVSVKDVSELNDSIEDGSYKELMLLGEALHEKKVAQIADIISKANKKVILIAGPSSSGKTTFANRLKIQLKVNGYNPITLSTDDYFVERENTPLDENGEYDFESIRAVDTKLFNQNLNDLIDGKEVDLPIFNFVTGKKEYGKKLLKINENQPIIIEGIHGLNEVLTSDISADIKFKIYISDLTQLNIDNHNRIPTTDTRLIRRIVRDSKYRGHDANRTIELWPNVRKGEEKNIFPFQEEADIMFNSALSFELAVLKKHAEPLLKEIMDESESYKEAKRLLNFLSYFKSVEDDDIVPRTSILKEFIGGSYFE